jgi:hypothetical protein
MKSPRFMSPSEYMEYLAGEQDRIKESRSLERISRRLMRGMESLDRTVQAARDLLPVIRALDDLLAGEGISDPKYCVGVAKVTIPGRYRGNLFSIYQSAQETEAIRIAFTRIAGA